jgi:hypothetical protein
LPSRWKKRKSDQLTQTALNGPKGSGTCEGPAVGLFPEISMHNDGKQVIETAIEARGGLLDKPVLLVLVVSCVLAVAALIVTYSGA